MTKFRRNAKIDNNQNEIVRALRQILGDVNVQVGHDDILIGRRGKTYWIEIKSPDEIAKGTGKVFNRKRKTKEKQDRLLAEFEGHYKIMSTLNQILKEIGL